MVTGAGAPQLRLSDVVSVEVRRAGGRVGAPRVHGVTTTSSSPTETYTVTNDAPSLEHTQQT